LFCKQGDSALASCFEYTSDSFTQSLLIGSPTLCESSETYLSLSVWLALCLFTIALILTGLTNLYL